MCLLRQETVSQLQDITFVKMRVTTLEESIDWLVVIAVIWDVKEPASGPALPDLDQQLEAGSPTI